MLVSATHLNADYSGTSTNVELNLMVSAGRSISNPLRNRREFLLASASAAFITMAAPSSSLVGGTSRTTAAEIGPLKPNSRASKAYQLRHKAALYERNLPLAEHPTNSDEELYPSLIGSYSKALPHNSLGEVDGVAYAKLLRALTTGDPHDFEEVPIAGAAKLTDPQAALAFELVGSDSHHLNVPAPPQFSSSQIAGEMVELYWQALTRDIPFADYLDDPLVNAATNELSQLSDFHGPKSGGSVTPNTIFRGPTPGAMAGPYISQFLSLDVPYPPTSISQQIRTTAPKLDYLTNYADWLGNQNGSSAGPIQFDPTHRFIRTGRDLAEYVHRDFTYQHFLSAALILLSFGPAALDRNNPYRKSANQNGFSTFGPPQVLDLVARVANAALNAAWFQKWSVHRRVRPEEFGGRIHNQRLTAANYPINVELLNSKVLDEVFSRFGSYLLPIAFPEGCPTHPAYPAGHAAISGACVTVLKWFFDQSFVIPKPVQASANGLSLLPYDGPELNVGGELDKLAYNVSLGRDTGGLHWRSDGEEGVKLGEAVALSILTELRDCFNESFAGFSLTKFDGTTLDL